MPRSSLMGQGGENAQLPRSAWHAPLTQTPLVPHSELCAQVLRLHDWQLWSTWHKASTLQKKLGGHARAATSLPVIVTARTNLCPMTLSEVSWSMTKTSNSPFGRPALAHTSRSIRPLPVQMAAAYGASAVVNFQRGYPATVNAVENTDFAAEVARSVSGKVGTDTAPMMGAEDFSYMLNERPGAYIFLGNGDTAMVHHPAYNFDDNAIPFGSSWYAGMVEARMPAA